MKTIVLTNLKDYPEIRDHVEKINGWIFRNQYFWWVVLDGDEWVAYAGLSHFDENTFYLGPTFVKEQYRGKGLQSRLIKLREMYVQIFLEGDGLISFVEKTNIVSAKNLKENGFVVVNTDANYYPETFNCFEKRFDWV